MLFVSVEMPRLAIGSRLVSMLSELPACNLRTNAVSKQAREQAISKAANVLAGGQLEVTDGLDNVRDIVALARAQVRSRDVQLCIVDYLQLCQPGEKHDTQNLRVASMSAEFKRLAQQTGIAVVVLSQLSRASDKDSRKPRLSDLRDSGAIEQDADVVLLLHKESNQPSEVEKVWADVAKNRNGPTLTIRLGFQKPTMLFVNLAAYTTGTE